MICSNPPFTKSLRMLVDTGASITSISDKDARTIGLNYSDLPQGDDSIGIGGRVQNYALVGIHLNFEDTKSSYYVEKLPFIVVMRGSDKAIPSLLGIDILKKYKVYFDEKGVILEK